VFTGLPENLGIKESLMIVYTLKTKNAEYSSTNPNIENTVYVDLNGNGNVDAGEKVTEVVKINEVKTGTIKKSSAQSSIDQNGVIDYTVVVTNTGNEAIKTGLFKDTISLEDKEKVEKVTGKVEFALIDVSANEDTATYQDISAAYNQTSGEVIFTGLPSAVPVSKKMVVKYSLQTTVFDTTEDDTIDNMVQIDINGDNTISDGVETSTVPVKVISKTDILLEKTSPMTTITSGEDITYTIKVTNLGNTPLKDYILEDTPEIDKINSDTLKNVVIKLNGSTLDNKNFVFNKNSNKFELINEKPLIPLNGVLEISYTVTSNLNITNISSGVTNTVRFKTDNTEKEATVVVNLSTINITKTANNENQVLQGGDEVVYTIVLKTTSEIEQQVTVKDNLLQVNNYNNSPIIKIEDIKDIKVNGVLLNNGKDIFTAQGLTLIIPGSSQENNLETIITYVLTIPKGISEEVKELKNQGLVIKNNLEIKSEEVVVELAKPKLLLRHDVFKFETKYNDSSQIILQEKPIADNMENIDGKNSKPPIIFAGDDLLYYISLINETEVPMKGEVDINHQLDKKQLKDDNGLNVFIENEFLGIVLTSLDTGEKIFYSEDDLLKIPEAISLGIIDQESSFEFEQLVPARSVISFVEKSKVNPKGIFAKKKEIVTYAYLPSDPLQNTSEGEIRKTVVSIGRKNTDLVLSKRSELEEASVGKFVPYIIQVKNVGEDPATDVYIQDKIPPGFIYVEGSAVQVLNESYTENKITATGVKEIKFGPISEIKSGDIVKIKYLLKVGVGVKPGTYKNIAVSVDNTDKTISNSDSVDVEIISDPIFEHTTIIGKVFHDRDGDGIQDYATAKNIVIDIEVPKNYYVPNTTTVFKNGGTYDFSDSYSRVTIREMKGRVSELEPATNNMVVIRKELKEPTLSTVRVQTNRGTDITQQSDGKVITNHTGDKVKGMTSQDIVIAQRVVKNKDNKIILEIFILNNGIQEEGLPGVRLATPEGIVVETDRFGRYHVPPVPETLGKNYIIKVDPTTLPKGAEFTTENPRVRHLGKVMMKFNFGVKLPPLKNPEKKESK
ncbi:MAG: hypothetical protein ACRC8M_11845, partial [Cetobacterium sp.]|uniref:hypothetical protein n=1 Tax=Cetobacterium sp. TaxID=2071632 RepID=UPI003F3936B3